MATASEAPTAGCRAVAKKVARPSGKLCAVMATAASMATRATLAVSLPGLVASVSDEGWAQGGRARAQARCPEKGDQRSREATLSP